MKKLAPVDTRFSLSTQHEVTGSEPLLAILGDQDRKKGNPFEATYIWLNDEQEAISEPGKLSWYDSRRNHPTRSEWRLYYRDNAITEIMNPGDTLIVARRPDDSLLFIVVPDGSTIRNQLLYLFGVHDDGNDLFVASEIGDGNDYALDFAARFIFDEIGIEFEDPDADKLDDLIRRFGTKFPKTEEFSQLARLSLPGIDARDDPDQALVDWLDQEEAMFRRLERKVVRERLQDGFATAEGVDVDGFLSFSLSVQNRRKSRMGHSLEHHLAAILDAFGVQYAKGATTEGKHKPDFLFPSREVYLGSEIDDPRLAMLASKSTCKDRWRQVLTEARKISEKHLLTLEPGISTAQTDQMRDARLQLVIPLRIHESYADAQRSWLWSVKGFLAEIAHRQSLAH